MATLTYDATEADAGEFSEEEQDSIRVGESLQEQEQQLLAGKFKDAEDLESAYLDLQSKLGQPREEQAEPEAEEQTEIVDEVSPDAGFLEKLWDESQGEYTQETLDELKNMSSEDLAQMYLDYRSEQPEAEPNTPLGDADVEKLQNVVGGEEQYEQLIGWASENISEGDIAMYDAVMDKGDPLSCFFAVQALAARYSSAVGYEGDMVTGKAPKQSQGNRFRSQAEVVRAMQDPRYDEDPAYRQDVMNALENSPDIQF